MLLKYKNCLENFYETIKENNNNSVKYILYNIINVILYRKYTFNIIKFIKIINKNYCCRFMDEATLNR